MFCRKIHIETCSSIVGLILDLGIADRNSPRCHVFVCFVLQIVVAFTYATFKITHFGKQLKELSYKGILSHTLYLDSPQLQNAKAGSSIENR